MHLDTLDTDMTKILPLQSFYTLIIICSLTSTFESPLFILYQVVRWSTLTIELSWFLKKVVKTQLLSMHFYVPFVISSESNSLVYFIVNSIGLSSFSFKQRRYLYFVCYFVLVDVEEVYLENKVNKEENTRWARAAFSSHLIQTQ